MPWLRLSVFALLLVANVGLVARYWIDNRFLYAWSLRYVDESDSPSEKVVGLARGFRILRNTEQSGLEVVPETGRILGDFGPLSLTPREVVEHGGPCESKSRLMRTLLHLHGIDSERVLLKQKRSHTVTDVEIEEAGRMVVDPLFGLVFPDPRGGYYSVDDLSRDPAIVEARIRQVLSTNGARADAYHAQTADYIELIGYRDPLISMEWRTDTLLRRVAHEMVSLVMGDDWLRTTSRPYLFERPALMVLTVTLGLQILVALTLVPWVWSRLRRAPADGRSPA